MSIDRTLDWDGCHNVRDLGGLTAAGGRKTRQGAIVRSAKIDGLTPAGWAALVAHGIRTIVDLREPSERNDLPPRPDGVTTVNIPLDDAADTDLWDHIREQELDGTPLYYPVFLEHKPERCAAAISAVAQAAPGGVLIHCAAGWDRTGLVSLLLLALAGVDADDIASDYLLSAPNMRPVFLDRGYGESIAETVTSLGGDGYLLAAGVSKADIEALYERLLD